MTGVMAKAVQPKRVPIRTCVACRTTGGKHGLIRVVRLPAEKAPAEKAESNCLVLDTTGKISGRGAYVCASQACVEQALKQKKLERSLRVPLPEELANCLKNRVAEMISGESTVI
jgi:uncharacterized protein